MRNDRAHFAVICLTLALVLLTPTALAADHPLSHSIVSYLPMPSSGEWTQVAVAPDGSRAYFTDAYERVAVIDMSDDSLITTITLPNNDFIGGITVGPTGRTFVTSRTRLMEIDPSTNTTVNNVAAPWTWEGHIVVTSDGQTAYAAGGDEIFVIDLSGGGASFVDTVPGGLVNGLVGANPGWSTGWLDAYRIALSPDDDRLYVVGDRGAGGLYPLVTIDGLTGGSYAGLTLNTVDMPNAVSAGGEPQIAVNAAGDLLFDSYGNVWQTSTMSVYQTVALDAWSNWDPSCVAQSPNGAYIYYQGWGLSSGTSRRTTYGGEELLVASGATYDLVDLDGLGSNGLTGINMPEGSGWDGLGVYNAHEMVIHPDGDKLYFAAGGSGALSIALSISPTSGLIVPDRGGNHGNVTVRVVGSFTAGTAVALRRSGQSDIAGTNTSVFADGTIETTFDLTGAQTGKYDVVFTPPSGSAWQIAQGFTVEEDREEATLDLLGDRVIEAVVGAPEAIVLVRAKNTGNVDLEDLIITFNLTAGTRFTVTVPPTIPGVATEPAEEHVADDQPVRVWVSRLPPQRTYTVEVAVAGQDTSPATWDVEMFGIVGYVQGPSSGTTAGVTLTRKDTQREGAIGELCTFGDAVIKGINAELRRRGENSLSATGEGVVGDVIRQVAIEYGAAKVSSIIAKALAQLVVTALVPQAMPVFAVTFGAVSDIKSCFDFAVSLVTFGVIFPSDPNDKLCAVGVGQYMRGSETLSFRIRFENVATASANAQQVRITDVLDDDLDWDTLVIGDSSHPDKLSVDLNATTRTITWTFNALNLPPNVTPPQGQGWVEFTVKSEASLADGATITNQARIYFDLNDPIDTNVVQRTIDRTPPTSAVAALSSVSNSTSLAVAWAGTDAGSGVQDYTVYVSRDNGSYSAWQEQTKATSATYTGEVGSTYKFYSVARDRLGNTEPAPSEADTTTAISLQATEQPAPACGCGGASAAMVALCILGLWRGRRT